MSCSARRWVLTVGLEIHAQLATPTKLFSGAPNRFGGRVNGDVAPFDLALPGSQPRLNQHAVLLAVRAALAFGCDINPASSFDRKHYFYPDQPAGYQITQNHNALAHRGSLSLFERDGTEEKEPITVGISQVQIEQDTARTTYYDSPPQSLIDLNRTGTPLIEIVTTPSIPSAKAAGAALRKIQNTLRAVSASDANMESGGMRCDVNVSVTTDADRHLGPSRRVEIKNLASGRSVSDAVTAEFARQVAVLASGGSVGRETRGFDIDRRVTFLMRTKESATEYRYMPDPDLGPIVLDETFLRRCREALPELPDAQLDRLLAAPYSLAIKDARVLLHDPRTLVFYECVLEKVGMAGSGVPKVVSNWIVHELFGRQRVMQESGRAYRTPTPTQLASLIRMVLDGSITGASGKQVLQCILDGDVGRVSDIVARENLAATSDGESLRLIVQEIMDAHAPQWEKLKGGDVKIKKWFVGQVMRRTRGSANALSVEKVIDSLIQ